MKVLLFGKLAEAMEREVELDVAAGATVGTVRRRLAELYPAAARDLNWPGVHGCLADTIVDDAAVIPAGAELAFFPALSGG